MACTGHADLVQGAHALPSQLALLPFPLELLQLQRVFTPGNRGWLGAAHAGLLLPEAHGCRDALFP